MEGRRGESPSWPRCENCHSENGVLNFRALGYSEFEARHLTNPGIYFEKVLERQKGEW